MPQYVYLTRPVRPDFAATMTEAERATWQRHWDELLRRHREGSLILVGRTQDEPPIGITVFEAVDDGAAEATMRSDPFVAEGLVIGELHPYRVALLRGVPAED